MSYVHWPTVRFKPGKLSNKDVRAPASFSDSEEVHCSRWNKLGSLRRCWISCFRGLDREKLCGQLRSEVERTKAVLGTGGGRQPVAFCLARCDGDGGSREIMHEGRSR